MDRKEEGEKSGRNKKDSKRRGGKREEEVPKASFRMKPADEIYSRIKWDVGRWNINDWTIGYEDRFFGVKEMPAESFAGGDIPMHRIRHFKIFNKIVWDRVEKLDNVFGSLGGDKIDNLIDSGALAPEKRANVDTIEPEVKSNRRHVGKKKEEPRLGPNYFLCARVVDEGIRKATKSIHRTSISINDSYLGALIPLECLHVTVSIFRLPDDISIMSLKDVVSNALREIIYQNGAQKFALVFEGVEMFESRVVYFKLREDEGFEKISFLARTLDQRIEKKASLFSKEKFIPHMTLLKVNRKTKANSVWEISREIQNQHSGDFGGTQVVEELLLCSVMEKADDGFYRVWGRFPLELTEDASNQRSSFVDRPLGRKNVKIFDFDGTMFKTIEISSANWDFFSLMKIRSSYIKDGLGLYLSMIPMMPPFVPLEVGDDFLVKEIVDKVKEMMSRDDCYLVLLTGRRTYFMERIKDICKQAGISFDQYILKGDNTWTQDYKRDWLDKFCKEFDPWSIELWDDDIRNLNTCKIAADSNGILFTPHKVLDRTTLLSDSKNVELGRLLLKEAVTFSSFAASGKTIVGSPHYVAVVLDKESIELIKNAFPLENGWRSTAHHMTIRMGKYFEGVDPGVMIGDVVELTGVRIGRSNDIHALEVEVNVPSVNKRKHITIGTSDWRNAQRKEANNIKNWERINNKSELKLRGTIREMMLYSITSVGIMDEYAELSNESSVGGKYSPNFVEIALFTILWSNNQIIHAAGIAKRRSVVHLAERAIREAALKVSNNAVVEFFPLGSYLMNCQNNESDIDLLAVVSVNVSEIISSLGNVMKMRKFYGMQYHFASGAKVPILTFSSSGIDVEFQFIKDESDSFDPHNTVVRELSAENRGILSMRDGEILAKVLDSAKKRFALKAIKYWAKQRRIYKTKFGFIGGIGFAVLLSYALNIMENEGKNVRNMNFADILEHFFRICSELDFGNNMVTHVTTKQRVAGVIGKGDSHMNRPVVLLTPSHPSVNIARNSTETTVISIRNEFRRANTIFSRMKEAASQSDTLSICSDLFADRSSEFLVGDYQGYIRLTLTGPTREFSSFTNWLESQVVAIVVDLEANIKGEFDLLELSYTNKKVESEFLQSSHYFIGVAKAATLDGNSLRPVFDRFINRFHNWSGKSSEMKLLLKFIDHS